MHNKRYITEIQHLAICYLNKLASKTQHKKYLVFLFELQYLLFFDTLSPLLLFNSN